MLTLPVAPVGMAIPGYRNLSMARRIPPPRYGIPRLSDHKGGKISVVCEKCGMQKRYDANEMFARIGDIQMPMLLMEIAKAEGCPRAGSKSEDRCMLHYDLAFASMWRKK
jgi:hypothetical protein